METNFNVREKGTKEFESYLKWFCEGFFVGGNIPEDDGS